MRSGFQPIIDELELTPIEKREKKLTKLISQVKLDNYTAADLCRFLQQLAEVKLDDYFLDKHPDVVIAIVKNIQDMELVARYKKEREWLFKNEKILFHFVMQISEINLEAQNRYLHRELITNATKCIATELSNWEVRYNKKATTFPPNVRTHLSGILTELFTSTESLLWTGYGEVTSFDHYLEIATPLPEMSVEQFTIFIKNVRALLRISKETHSAAENIQKYVGRAVRNNPPSWSTTLTTADFYRLYAICPEAAEALIAPQNLPAILGGNITCENLSTFFYSHPDLAKYVVGMTNCILTAFSNAGEFREFYDQHPKEACDMLEKKSVATLLASDTSLASLLWFAKLWKESRSHHALDELRANIKGKGLYSANDLVKISQINKDAIAYVIFSSNKDFEKYAIKFSNISDLTLLLSATHDEQIARLALKIIATNPWLFRYASSNAERAAKYSPKFMHDLLEINRDKWPAIISHYSNSASFLESHFVTVNGGRWNRMSALIAAINTVDDLLAIDERIDANLRSWEDPNYRKYSTKEALGDFQRNLNHEECALTGKIKIIFATPQDVLRFLSKSQHIKPCLVGRYAKEIAECLDLTTYKKLHPDYQAIFMKANPTIVAGFISNDINIDKLVQLSSQLTSNPTLSDVLTDALFNLFEKSTLSERLKFVKYHDGKPAREQLFTHDAQRFAKCFTAGALNELAKVSPLLAWQMIKVSKDNLPSLFGSQTLMHELFQQKPAIKAKVEKKNWEVKFNSGM